MLETSGAGGPEGWSGEGKRELSVGDPAQPEQTAKTVE